MIGALAAIKQAAALANMELGLLDETRGRAIVAACEEVRGGQFHAHFLVDVIQGGAGTSTNMNANEVIANRALEHLGHGRGEYSLLHPNEHVNMSQSTNDVYPTALKIATYHGLRELGAAMEGLRLAFARKAEEFTDVLKMGRTQLQDAVPMTLGQEFHTYAVMIGEDQERLREAALVIHEINMGATSHWHRDQRASGLRTPRLSPSECSHRIAARDRAGSCGSHTRLRCVRPSIGRAEADRGQALEDLQRPQAALERPPGRLQ